MSEVKTCAGISFDQALYLLVLLTNGHPAQVFQRQLCVSNRIDRLHQPSIFRCKDGAKRVVPGDDFVEALFERRALQWAG